MHGQASSHPVRRLPMIGELLRRSNVWKLNRFFRELFFRPRVQGYFFPFVRTTSGAMRQVCAGASYFYRYPIGILNIGIREQIRWTRLFFLAYVRTFGDWFPIAKGLIPPRYWVIRRGPYQRNRLSLSDLPNPAGTAWKPMNLFAEVFSIKFIDWLKVLCCFDYIFGYFRMRLLFGGVRMADEALLLLCLDFIFGINFRWTWFWGSIGQLMGWWIILGHFYTKQRLECFRLKIVERNWGGLEENAKYSAKTVERPSEKKVTVRLTTGKKKRWKIERGVWKKIKRDRKVHGKKY